MREIVTCTDVQQKKPVSIFVNGQFVLCIHVHNFKSFCNSKSHLQVYLMMVICLFVLWCFIWKCVGMCVWFNPLGQSVFQFANFDTFWKTWLRTCTCLILNIFCSPVVSMKSHLSLRTNTNVLILFLTTVFRRRKMTALFILYVFNSFHICL